MFTSRPKPTASPPVPPRARGPAAAPATLGQGWTGLIAASRATPGCAAAGRRSGRWSRCCAVPDLQRRGLALMRLLPALLLRVPDADPPSRSPPTSSAAPTRCASAPRVRTACWPRCRPARSRCPKFLPDAEQESGLLKRLGAQTVVAATVRALQCSAASSCSASTSARRWPGARPPRPAGAALQLRHAGRRRPHHADARATRPRMQARSSIAAGRGEGGARAPTASRSS